MNVYAEKVKQYLEEEQIPYSCEEMGETDENFLIYAITKDTPNIWAEVEDCGRIQLTSYLKHDIGEEKQKKIQDRKYVVRTNEEEFQIFLDEEGSVTAQYQAELNQRDIKDSFARSMYAFLFSVNQCVRDVLTHT